MKKECKNCLRHYNNQCLQCNKFEYFEEIPKDSFLYSSLKVDESDCVIGFKRTECDNLEPIKLKKFEREFDIDELNDIIHKSLNNPDYIPNSLEIALLKDDRKFIGFKPNEEYIKKCLERLKTV